MKEDKRKTTVSISVWQVEKLQNLGALKDYGISILITKLLREEIERLEAKDGK